MALHRLTLRFGRMGDDLMARVAVVTGGTRGIGEAICQRLKRQGHTVIANYAGNEEKARAFTSLPA